MFINLIKKLVKKENPKDSSEESFNIDPYIVILHSIIEAIDTKNIEDIKFLNKDMNENNKNDIIFELYNNNLLTSERLQFIMNCCTKYFNISPNLIKKLISESKVTFLDIIFNYIKFYDNEFILHLLIYYKNKTTISTSDLNQQISNEKYKISINNELLDNSSYFDIGKYLSIECSKKYENINIIKYLIDNGIDINKEVYFIVKDYFGNRKRFNTPLFNA